MRRYDESSKVLILVASEGYQWLDTCIPYGIWRGENRFRLDSICL